MLNFDLRQIYCKTCISSNRCLTKEQQLYGIKFYPSNNKYEEKDNVFLSYNIKHEIS